jgi:hypothetical protein
MGFMGRATWYVKRDGRILGSYGSDEIRRMVAEGTLLPSDKLRKGGTKAWRRAGRSRKLFPPPEAAPADDAEPWGEEFDVFTAVELAPTPIPDASVPGREREAETAASDWSTTTGSAAAPRSASHSRTSYRLYHLVRPLAVAGILACGAAVAWLGYRHHATWRRWLWPPPFQLVEVSGRVTYEDGAPLDCDDLFIAFHPSHERRDARTYPRTAHARVDSETGTFRVVDEGRLFGGVVAGPHRVTLHVGPPGRIPPHVAEPIYEDVQTTPLRFEVDGRSPIHVEVQRPPPAPSPDDG